MADTPLTIWTSRLRDFLPGFAQSVPELASLAGHSTVLLHGSTTRGIADDWSDLDVWMLPPGQHESCFIVFKLDDKAGHVTIESRKDFSARVRQCDFNLIYEFRHAVILQDPDGWGDKMLALARQPMPAAVRAAWFAHHYIEMRSEHRACDNPIYRNDAVALLQAMTPTISHSLRAAMVLDGQPYPYHKWLASAAAKTPTGAQIVPLVEGVIDSIGAGTLRLTVPERQHPLNLLLKEIRIKLITAARAGGIDAEWLDLWYLHLDVRNQIHDVTWDGGDAV